MTRFASLLLSCSCNLSATSLCVILVVLPGSLTRWEWRSYRSSMRISSGISTKCSVTHLEARTAPAPLPVYFCIVCSHHMPHLYAGIQVRQNTDCRCALARPCCRPPRLIAKLGDSCNLATSLCVILVVLPGSLTRWEWRSYRNIMRISSGISAKCSVPHLEVRTAPAPLPAYFCIVCRYHMPHLYAGIQVRQNTNCRCRKNIFCCHFYYGCWYWCC